MRAELRWGCKTRYQRPNCLSVANTASPNPVNAGSNITFTLVLTNNGPSMASQVTTPLRALFNMQKIHKDRFYHDGRFATMTDVVEHYDSLFKLNPSVEQKRDLIEYLKSI